MVWSSANSTLIDPLALVFPFSANPPLRSVDASGKALYRQCLVGPKMFPLRCGETHPYGAPRRFERYSPKCVEGVFSEVRRHGVLRSSQARSSQKFVPLGDEQRIQRYIE